MIDRGTILNMAFVSGDINEYLLSLYNIPVQMNAQTILEIGSGVSTFALVAAANKTGGHITSIDIAGAETLNRTPNGEDILKGEPNFTMVQGSSLEVPWDKEIDFFFLDSEHTYQLTKDEMHRWFPLVRKGGVIMMHDTAHEAGQQMQCRQALNEFLESEEGKGYRAVFLLDTKIIGMGIIVKL